MLVPVITADTFRFVVRNLEQPRGFIDSHSEFIGGDYKLYAPLLSDVFVSFTLDLILLLDDIRFNALWKLFIALDAIRGARMQPRE